MRKYEEFLKSIAGFVKILAIVVIAGGIGFGLIYGVYTSTKADADTQEANRVVRMQCLDQGGNIVKIHGVKSCFELSEVELEVSFMGSRETACKRNPNLAWIRSPNGGSFYCYSYKRITEN